jgi:hypothetical protein
MLVVAEEVEVFSALQARGWDCGASNGEGLSRVLATELYSASLNGFNSASTWLDTAGRPDFINNNDPTDRNYISIGCSTLFLNYLRYQLGYKWEDIVTSAGSTLQQTYQSLTGQSDGLTPFKNLLQVHYPEGTPSWHDWESLGGYCILGPSVSSWDHDRLDTFVVGPDNAMYHKSGINKYILFTQENEYAPSTICNSNLTGSDLGQINHSDTHK